MSLRGAASTFSLTGLISARNLRCSRNLRLSSAANLGVASRPLSTASSGLEIFGSRKRPVSRAAYGNGLSSAQRRSYAWSRSPNARDSRAAAERVAREAAKARQRGESLNASPSDTSSSPSGIDMAHLYGGGDFGGGSIVRRKSTPEEGLRRLLANDTIVVVRQIEMMNIFLGFEQANRYALLDPEGRPIGYMAEEERGFLSTLQRQIFRTHRPFRSTILDTEGNVVLRVNRPFAWINSRTFVQRVFDEEQQLGTVMTEEGKEKRREGEDEDRSTIGEVQQVWHLWRRKYNVFTGEGDSFAQFAAVDSPFLSWDFYLQDEGNRNLASVVRNFTGLGRELFTDTGQYVVSFRPIPGAPSELASGGEQGARLDLSLEQRATVLALAATLDIDFFSRHSESGGMGLPWWVLFTGGEE